MDFGVSGNQEEYARTRDIKSDTSRKKQPLQRFQGLWPGSQGQILVLTALYMSSAFDIGVSFGDTTPCKVTPVILHGIVSPDSGYPTRGCIPRLRLSYTGLYPPSPVILHGVVSLEDWRHPDHPTHNADRPTQNSPFGWGWRHQKELKSSRICTAQLACQLMDRVGGARKSTQGRGR